MLRSRCLGLLGGLADVASTSGRGQGLLERAAASAWALQSSWAAQQQRSYGQPALAQQPAGVAAVLPPLEPRQLTGSTRRSGVIGVKVGMTQEWDHWGVRIPLTVLWIDDCQVGGGCGGLPCTPSAAVGRHAMPSAALAGGGLSSITHPLAAQPACRSCK